MNNTPRLLATDGREDISQFVIHLTRNDQDDYEDGNTAKNNFQCIMRDRKIIAVRPHCLFNKRLNTLSTEDKQKLNVACFTEVPLDQLHLLVREIPGREIKFEPYGFVFSKEFIIESGGQPAIYINSYNRTLYLREAVDEIFKISHKNGRFVSKIWRILPFINAMNEKYDFSWEREWRINGDLEFELNDLVCVILPEDKESSLKQNLAKKGIAVISPGWTYEQIANELVKQQKLTKQLHIEEIKRLKKEINRLEVEAQKSIC
ncbi:MAG TPA: hypothetical protein VK184_21615 [Nostocaceae cyanobacterium]|nr:hypothetical protein [Nostocaceae cyanobacterium]